MQRSIAGPGSIGNGVFIAQGQNDDPRVLRVSQLILGLSKKKGAHVGLTNP